MARSVLLNLNVRKCNLFLNTSKSSLFCKICVRYLRGSRYSKDGEDVKLQQLLRKLNNKSAGSEAIESENSINYSKTISHENAHYPSNNEPLKQVTEADLIKKIEEKMTPFADVPYYKELKKKHQQCTGILKMFGYMLHQLNVPISMGSDKLPCPLDYVVPSPVIEAYRNKDIFNIGLGLNGKEKTVGFFLDSLSEFSTTFCIKPKEISVIKEGHKKIAQDFENYIQSSPLPANQHFKDKGFWKNLVVKSNSSGDLMGIVVVHPQDFTQEQLNEEKDKLRDYFSGIPKAEYNLHSLYFQACSHSNCTHEQSPYELILGEPYIIEEMSGLKLSISPDSFFQPNTKATESMYNALLKLCRLNKSMTLLDLNCGIGPLSLVFSRFVKNCIGIEESIQAFADAKSNCETNNINNVQFFHGRPEHLVKDILQNGYFNDILTVINSSGGEISKNFMKVLRDAKYIQKIVYITHKPKAALDNFAQLCRPAGPLRELGQPFMPILALPIDLNPRTNRVTIAIMLQRL